MKMLGLARNQIEGLMGVDGSEDSYEEALSIANLDGTPLRGGCVGRGGSCVHVRTYVQTAAGTAMRRRCPLKVLCGVNLGEGVVGTEWALCARDSESLGPVQTIELVSPHRPNPCDHPLVMNLNHPLVMNYGQPLVS